MDEEPRLVGIPSMNESKGRFWATVAREMLSVVVWGTQRNRVASQAGRHRDFVTGDLNSSQN
jgi:hypothetical protein